MSVDLLRLELKDNFPFTNGLSFDLFESFFLHLRILRVSNQNIIKSIKGKYDRIATKSNLQKLIDLGYLGGDQNIFYAKDKAIKLIKTDKILLPNEYNGKGEINTFTISENISYLLRQDPELNYSFILYPHFPEKEPYLIPDALILIKSIKKYKLVFLEIERKKSEWENYLEEKIYNYKQISSNKLFYNYWASKCKLFDLPKPKYEEFKFSLYFIGYKKTNFIDGIEYFETIEESYKYLIN